jgi:hypothetical protein
MLVDTPSGLGGSHFKTVLYTGDGNSGRSIVGVGFTPDLVWVKSRSSANYHFLFDSVRGPNRFLFSNTTTNETIAASMAGSAPGGNSRGDSYSGC